MSKQGRALMVAAALPSLCATSAHGVKPELFLAAQGQCPEAEALRKLVLAFVPDGHVFASQPRIEVRDRGESYDVTVIADGQRHERSYDDAERHCEQRARFAAVFVVLTLLPPELWPDSMAQGLSEAEPTTRGPQRAELAPLPSSAPPVSTSAPLVALELAAFVQTAPGWSSHVAASLAGAELRTLLGRGAWAASVGVDFSPETEFAAGPVPATLTRYSGRAGLRWRSSSEPLGLYGDVTAVAMLQRVRGQELFRPEQDSAVDFGARVETGLRGQLGAGLGAFLGLHATLVPFPRALRADPQGELGRLPSLWVGATLGGAFEP